MRGSNMLLSYHYSTGKFQMLFLAGEIVADKESLASAVRLRFPSRTQGFLPVNMDLQLPVLVEWRSHIHSVPCGGP